MSKKLTALIRPAASGRLGLSDVRIWGGPKGDNLLCRDVKVYSGRLGHLRLSVGYLTSAIWRALRAKSPKA